MLDPYTDMAKKVHPSRTRKILQTRTFWSKRRRLPLQLCRWTYFAKKKKKKKKKKLYPRNIERQNINILVAILFGKFETTLEYYDSIETRVKHAFHLFSLHHNYMIDRCGF